MADAIADKYDELKTDAETLVSKGKEKYNGIKSEIKNQVD